MDSSQKERRNGKQDFGRGRRINELHEGGEVCSKRHEFCRHSYAIQCLAGRCGSLWAGAPPLRRYLERVDRHFVRLKTQSKDTVKAFMQKAKKVLVESGFASKNVVIKIRKKKTGIARDVLKEVERGKYDTLVIGRRGLSGVKQFVLGSVSTKIVKFAKKASVIVVD
jgi:nucleotide-binding universal stress UspA family protein